MRLRFACINDLPIKEPELKYYWQRDAARMGIQDRAISVSKWPISGASYISCIFCGQFPSYQ
jgi:hypothetical protein